VKDILLIIEAPPQRVSETRELVLLADLRHSSCKRLVGALIGRTFDRAEISGAKERRFREREIRMFVNARIPAAIQLAVAIYALCERILDCGRARCRFVVDENENRRRVRDIFRTPRGREIRSSRKNFRTGRVTTISPPPVQPPPLSFVDLGTAVFFR